MWKTRWLQELTYATVLAISMHYSSYPSARRYSWRQAGSLGAIIYLMEQQCSLADFIPPLPSFLVLIHSQGSSLAKEKLSYCSFQLLSPPLSISSWLITVSGQNKCRLPDETTGWSATACQTDISQLKKTNKPTPTKTQHHWDEYLFCKVWSWFMVHQWFY